MSWALAIPAVVAAVSAIAQWSNSNAAQNATASERARIKGMLNKIKDPNFDVSMIMPEELQLVGKYIPQSIPLIQEAAPQMVRAQSSGAQQGRGAQLSALQQMQQLARAGRDPLTEIARARAERSASAEASSARASAAQEAQRRGFNYSPGGGMAGTQDAMQRLALAGQQAAGDAQNRRMQAMGQAGQLGGQIFGQDVDIETGNVNAANAFNARMAQNAQNIAQANTGIFNQANQQNFGEMQRVSDANKIARYGAKTQNQGLRNTQAQQQFQNSLNKVGVYSGQAEQAQKAATEGAKQNNETLQALTDLAAKGGMYYDSKNDPNKKDPLVRG